MSADMDGPINDHLITFPLTYLARTKKPANWKSFTKIDPLNKRRKREKSKNFSLKTSYCYRWLENNGELTDYW